MHSVFQWGIFTNVKRERIFICKSSRFEAIDLTKVMMILVQLWFESYKPFELQLSSLWWCPNSSPVLVAETVVEAKTFSNYFKMGEKRQFWNSLTPHIRKHDEFGNHYQHITLVLSVKAVWSHAAIWLRYPIEEDDETSGQRSNLSKEYSGMPGIQGWWKSQKRP